MAIEPNQRQTLIQPADRLVREFRTDLPSVDMSSVRGLGQTIAGVGEDIMKRNAEASAKKIAYGVELGRDELGNYTVPEPPENMGMFRRDIFDTIVKDRADNMSLVDLQQQFVEIRASYLDNPLAGIDVMKSAAEARLAALDPESRGRLGPAFLRELASHSGTMLMDDARKTQEMTIAGIESDAKRGWEEALSAFSLGTEASTAEGERIVGEIMKRNEWLIATKQRPPESREDIQLVADSLRSTGGVLGVIRTAAEEQRITAEDLKDLQAVIRDPYFNENVLGISAEEIRKGLRTEEGRTALAAQVNRLESAWQRQTTAKKGDQLYTQVTSNLQAGYGGFPVGTSDEDKFKVMARWSAETGVDIINPAGQWNLTPANVGETYQTFREMPDIAIKEWFRSPQGMTKDELQSRLELFTYLHQVPTGNGDYTEMTSAIDGKDYQFMKQLDAAVRGGKPIETAVAEVNELFKRGKQATISYDDTTSALVGVLKAEGNPEAGRADVDAAIAEMLPKTGLFSSAQLKDIPYEVRAKLSLAVYQETQLNEAVTFADAVAHAVPAVLAEYQWDETQVSARGTVGSLVPKNRAAPQVASVGAGTERSRTSEYAGLVVKRMFDLDIEGDMTDPDEKPAGYFIDEAQPWGTIDRSTLEWGENLAIRQVGGDAKDPHFNVMVKDGNDFWHPVYGRDDAPIEISLTKQSKREDDIRRDVEVMRERAAREQWDWMQEHGDSREPIGEHPEVPAVKETYAPIYYDEVILPSQRVVPRGPLIDRATGDGTRTWMRGLRNDPVTPVAMPGGAPIPPGQLGVDDTLDPRFLDPDEVGAIDALPDTVDPAAISFTGDAAAAKTRIAQFGVDKRRQRAIGGVSDVMAVRVASMVDAMPADVRAGFAISSSYRSVEEQRRIYNATKAKRGKSARKWAAPPGKSYHNHGKAMDLKFANSTTKKWVHDNAAKFGLWFPMGHEPWHIEPMGTRGSAEFQGGDSEDPH